ncbi:MAG: TM0106 family RecB-like putative nuclease, partial [Nitrospiraceae bacterium]
MSKITANDLYNLTKCSHRVYLDANGDPRDKSEVSPFVKLLWELGLQTEREYLGTVGDVPVSDLSPLSVDPASDETRRLMQCGAPLIYQGCLKDGSFVGRPDLLVKRTDAPSQLGPYLYEPIDIKAGKGWEERDGKRSKFKEHYAFQILFYHMLLSRIQGAAPSTGRIINVDHEIEEFDPTLFEEDFAAALGEAERLVTGQETSEPVLGSHCQLCHWHRRCERWVEERSDPTGLFFVGRQKFQLKQLGLQTITDIAAMDVGEYLKPPKKMTRMGRLSLERMKERARVRLAGVPTIRPGYTFPQKGREIYFDIEDDPTQGLTYLFGLLIKDKQAKPHFQYFVARQPDEEEQTVRAFWDFVRSAGDVVYYVYSHKERTTLKQLMGRYELDEDVFEQYVAHEYDLYTKLVVEYSDWPTHSYGIKHIAKIIGFTWRDPDPSGANSIAWYNEYRAHP